MFSITPRFSRQFTAKSGAIRASHNPKNTKGADKVAFLAPVHLEARKNLTPDQKWWAYMPYGEDGGFYGGRRLIEVLNTQSGLRNLFIESDDPLKKLLGYMMLALGSLRRQNPETFDKYFDKIEPLTICS